MPLFLVERHGVPLADVHLVLRSGAASDQPARAGLASLAATLFEEGTAARTAHEIADSLEHLGADLDIETGWDATTLALRSLAPRLDDALAVFAELVTSTSLAETDFARKQGERLDEWLADRADLRVLARERFHHAVYGPEHPFGLPADGTHATVEALTVAQARTWHERHAHAGNAFVVAVGDFDGNALVASLEEAFGSWSDRRPHAGGSDHELPPVPAPSRTLHLVDRAGAFQSEIIVGHAGPPRSTPDYFPLLVLNTVLGGSFTSRLNQRLREEKGYTYGVRSRFSFRRGPGPFSVAVAVDTAATADTVHEIVREIERLLDEPVTATELERARHYLARGLPRRIESGQALADALANLEIHGYGPAELGEFVDRVLAVDAAAVQAAASRHLDPGSLAIAIAGDGGLVMPELESLELGPILVEPVGPAQLRR